MKRLCWVSVLLLLAVGCRPKPQFVNHSQPALTIDFDAFNDLNSLSIGCDGLDRPHDLLGGFNPSYPIATCLVQEGGNTADESEGGYFYRAGGLLGFFVRYVIYRDGQFEVIRTEEALQEVFGPVETAEEALSFALAVRNWTPLYNLHYDPTMVYSASVIEDTHVERVADGYRVFLYDFQYFGCGPHTMDAVVVHVSTEGGIEEIGRRPVFRDPKLDDVCID